MRCSLWWLVVFWIAVAARRPAAAAAALRAPAPHRRPAGVVPGRGGRGAAPRADERAQARGRGARRHHDAADPSLARGRVISFDIHDQGCKAGFFDTTQSEGQPVRLCTLQLPTLHFPNVPFKKFPAVLQEQIMTTTTKRRESKRLV